MEPSTPSTFTGAERTPASSSRKRARPQTPHTLRALRIRAATPSRRRSLKKKTPRDDLRILSRALAKEKAKEKSQTRLSKRKSSLLSGNYDARGNDDPDIVVPIGDDDDDDAAEEDEPRQSRSSITSSKSRKSQRGDEPGAGTELEMHRRLSNRLSLAGPRLSEAVEFPSGLLSENRRVSQSQYSEPFYEDDDTVNLVPEDSFRIQFNDNLGKPSQDMEFDQDVDMDFGVDMDMDMDMGIDENGDALEPHEDRTLPLKVPRPPTSSSTMPSSSSSRGSNRVAEAKASTAIPRRIIKDTLKTLTDSRITADAFESIIETSERFFDQITQDLSDYSSHARRKKVDTADVVMLMKRQRLLDDRTPTAFNLAHKRLPAELLEELDKR